MNIVTTDLDDDARLAGAEEGLTEEQVSELTKLLQDKGRDVEKFCAYAQIDALSELAQSRYEAACNYVRNLKT